MSLWRILWTAAIFAIPAASFAASNSGLIQVTNVRAWSHADSTRVIVETTGPFEYQSERANNPDRLYVDILHSRPWIARRRLATREIGDKLVRRVRIAETSPGITRIVFDLVNQADFKITRLDAPDRMVIELRLPANPRSSALAVYAGLSPDSRHPFVYPPVLRRPQVSMPGAPPPLTLSMLQNAPEPVPFSFTDPMESLLTSLRVKPRAKCTPHPLGCLPPLIPRLDPEQATTRLQPLWHPRTHPALSRARSVSK